MRNGQLTFNITPVLRGVWRVASSEAVMMHVFRSLTDALTHSLEVAGSRRATIYVHDVNGMEERSIEVNA